MHFRPPVSREPFLTDYMHHNPAAHLPGLISGQSSSPSTSMLQQDLASCNSQTPFALDFLLLYMLFPCLEQVQAHAYVAISCGSFSPTS